MIVKWRFDSFADREPSTSFGAGRIQSHWTLDGFMRALGVDPCVHDIRVGKLFWPDSKRMAEAGFGSVAQVPVLFDGREQYRREANRYLRERARLEWTPSDPKGYPAPLTLEAIARAVDHFIEWCERRSLDWKLATYENVCEYQREQRTGQAAKDGRPLSPNTVNLRADEATNFLRWAHARGIRQPFEVPIVRKTRIFVGKGGRQSRAAEVRAGREKPHRSGALSIVRQLPSPVEVADWLLAVRNNRGMAKFLLCRFVVETGVRLGEAVSITRDQWPDEEAIEKARASGHNRVAMKLAITKGNAPRTIELPLRYASEVRGWIDGLRMQAVAKALRDNRKFPDETDFLWISDSDGHEGTRIKRHTLYKCFTKVKPRPRPWHPHLGRHTYACYWMLSFLDKEAGGYLHEKSATWVQERGELALDLLRRQLGHVSEETTQIYLHWLTSAAGLPDLANAWHERLSDALAEADGDA